MNQKEMATHMEKVAILAKRDESDWKRAEKDIDSQLLKAEKNKQSILASAFSGILRLEGI